LTAAVSSPSESLGEARGHARHRHLAAAQAGARHREVEPAAGLGLGVGRQGEPGLAGGQAVQVQPGRLAQRDGAGEVHPVEREVDHLRRAGQVEGALDDPLVDPRRHRHPHLAAQQRPGRHGHVEPLDRDGQAGPVLQDDAPQPHAHQAGRAGLVGVELPAPLRRLDHQPVLDGGGRQGLAQRQQEGAHEEGAVEQPRPPDGPVDLHLAPSLSP
jgi:hypothetical protein